MRDFFKEKEKVIGLSFLFFTFFLLFRIVPMMYDGWASKFAYASSDGFINYITIGLKNLYLTCNGRVISNLVCGILESFTSEIPLDIFNALLLVAIYYFLFFIFKNKIQQNSFLMGSFLFLALILFISPNMRMDVLFYANTAYMAPIPLLFLYYILFKKYLDLKKNKYLIFMSLIGFTIGMWMEHIAFGFCTTISLMAFIFFINKNENRWKLILPVIASIIGFLIMMLAPGLRVNREVVSTAPIFEIIFTNLKGLYVDIICNNLLLFIVMFIFLGLITLAKTNKKFYDYIYSISLFLMSFVMLLAILYNTYEFSIFSFISIIFPYVALDANNIVCICMTFFYLLLINLGIFNFLKGREKEAKDIYIFIMITCLACLLPILITPNTGARISAVGFFLFVCLTICFYFELTNLNLKMNKFVNFGIVIILLLALDKTILLERRIYNVNQKRNQVIDLISNKQKLNEWDYSKYAFLPIYQENDIRMKGAIAQSTIHYSAFLQAYDLDQRTNIIFSNHNISAVNEISIRNGELWIKTDLKNKELIKYNVTYCPDTFLCQQMEVTDWGQEDYRLKVINGYYIIKVNYKQTEQSEDITDNYEIYVA